MPLSITNPFRQARETLGVSLDADAKAIRSAYRKAVAKNPPDRSPEAFRRIRTAYELLSDPLERASELLMHPMPHVQPPPLPDAVKPSTEPSVECAVLRAVAGRIPITAMLGALETPS